MGLGALPDILQFICEGTATVGGVAKAVGGVGISGGGSGGKSWPANEVQWVSTDKLHKTWVWQTEYTESKLNKRLKSPMSEVLQYHSITTLTVYLWQACIIRLSDWPLQPVVRFSSKSLPSPQLSMPFSSHTRLRGIHFPFLQVKYGSLLHSDWLKPEKKHNHYCEKCEKSFSRETHNDIYFIMQQSSNHFVK